MTDLQKSWKRVAAAPEAGASGFRKKGKRAKREFELLIDSESEDAKTSDAP